MHAPHSCVFGIVPTASARFVYRQTPSSDELRTFGEESCYNLGWRSSTARHTYDLFDPWLAGQRNAGYFEALYWRVLYGSSTGRMLHGISDGISRPMTGPRDPQCGQLLHPSCLRCPCYVPILTLSGALDSPRPHP